MISVMSNIDVVKAVFKAIDQFNVTAFSAYFTDNAVFRFANQPPVTGKMAIQGIVSAFLQSIKSIEHTDIKTWTIDEVMIINGWVNYTRLDNTSLKVPFSVTLTMEGKLIKEYLIFIDNSEL